MKDQFFQNETHRFTLCDDMIHKSRILTIITARKRSLGQGNKFTSVCLSTGGGGVPDQVHPPEEQTPPPGADTPWEQTPPQHRHPPGPGTPPRADTPNQVHPPPPGADTPPGPGTPPPPGADTHPPPRADTHTPQADTPPLQSMLGDTVNARAVRILLECNLV